MSIEIMLMHNDDGVKMIEAFYLNLDISYLEENGS